MRIKIIDKEGNEIGCMERKFLVPFGLRHEIVRVIAYLPKTGEVLLQQRSLKKDSCPGMWDTSASGHVDAHEKTNHAVLRELREEIGLNASASSLLYIGSLDTSEQLENGRLERTTRIYCLPLAKVPANLRVDPVELEQISWLRLEELITPHRNGSKEPSLLITPSALSALQVFQQWLKDHPHLNIR